MLLQLLIVYPVYKLVAFLNKLVCLMSRLTGNAAKISMQYYDRKIFGWIQVFQLLQSKLPFRISFTEFFILNTLPPNMSPATL